MAFFDFLKKPVNAVKNNASGIAHAGFNFLEDTFVPGASQIHSAQAQVRDKLQQVQSNPQVAQQIQNSPQLSQQFNQAKAASDPQSDVYLNKNNMVGAKDLVVGAARGIARVPETVTRSVVQAETDPLKKQAQQVLDQLNQTDTSKFTPDQLNEYNANKDKVTKFLSKDAFTSGTNTGIREALYGKEPLQTYQTRTQGNRDVVAGSRFKGIATPLSFGAGLLTVGGDVTGVGGGEKAVIKEGADKLITSVVKEGTESGIKKILADKLAPEIIDKLAPALAKVTDKNVARNLFDQAGIDVKTLVTNQGKKVVSDINKAPTTLPDAKTAPQLSHITSANNIDGIIKDGKLRQSQALDIPNTNAANAFERQNGVSLSHPDNASLMAHPGQDNVVLNYDHAVVKNEAVKSGTGMRYLGDEAAAKADLPNSAIRSASAGTEETAQKLKDAGIPNVTVDPSLNLSKATDVTKAPRTTPVTKSEFIPKPEEKLPVNGAALQAKLGSDASKAPSIVPTTEDPLAASVAQKLRGNAAGPGEAGVPGMANLQAKQAELNKTSRAAQTARAQAAADGLTGEAKLKAIRGAQAGTFEKVDTKKLVESVQRAVPESDYAKISVKLSEHPDLSIHDQANAVEAWKNFYREGKLPTPSQSKLLDKVLGADFTTSLEEHAASIPRGFKEKALESLGQVASVPKSIMASMDLSGGFRQGGVLGSRFPKEFKRAMTEQVKYFGSPAKYEAGMKEIASRPNAEIYDKMKLALTGVKEFAKPEEQFVGGLAEKVPILGKGVAASDRAYTGVLTKLRADVADHIIGNLESAGIRTSEMSQKQLEDIGRFINTASGRGDLGSLEKHAQTLSTALFSPRLWKSRLDMLNPLYYAKLDPVARKYAIQSAASFAGIATAVLGIAAAAGAQVGTDPRSSDFGKIKVGNTRYDILGGFQQNIRVAAQLITGEKINTANGSVQKLDGGFGGKSRWNVLEQFGLNKANPIIGATQKVLSSKTPTGDAVNPYTEIGKLFVPLSIQDAYQGFRDSGGKGVAKTLPGIIGVGVQNYQVNISNKQKEYITALQKKNASPDQIKATTEFFQTIKKAPDSQKVSADIKTALESGDKAKAVQLANDYNKSYAASFKGWADKYGKQYSSKDLIGLYNRGKIDNTQLSGMISDVQKAKANKAKGVVKL